MNLEGKRAVSQEKGQKQEKVFKAKRTLKLEKIYLVPGMAKS